MTWDNNEHALPRALADLAERFPGDTIEILTTFDLAWIGWEGDCRGALVSRNGKPELVAIDQTISQGLFAGEVMGRIAEYRRLIEETERVLAQYAGLGGIE